MLKPLRNLLELWTPRSLPEDLSYEGARQVLEGREQSNLQALAARTDIQPEILYYLATHSAPDVRQAVAGNPATPHKANQLLVTDHVDEVRAELARKIARLLPDSDDAERTLLRDRTIELLEQLALDQAPKIRQILAEELKASTTAPKALIRCLARDPELAVAAPVLEYSPLLSDEDLKEIIAFSSVKGALSAIARRGLVSESVVEGIAAALDVPAVAALLANPQADIREDTLNFIIDNAAAIEDWHAPLVLRPNLSLRLMRRIAGFVASSLIEVMVRAQDIAPEDGAVLLNRVRERIQSEPLGAEDKLQVQATVTDLFVRGAIDEKFIIDAIDGQRRDALCQALALLADLAAPDVDKIFESRNARRIVALAWRAQLSMRTAFRLQAEVAHVPHRQLVNARDGVDYPLSPAQMAALMEPFQR
ncbi:DUF2336 domain-containing protein [Govanella unica]|uniref:DUF2336 domain-containing protein n=1 Tax=Govanella unica TaxID=2975056 RepID=A0A9X3Z6A9_9PROT|nr:DUF2336 domain-containing protein [Govania unica]MDA5192946.1 DUF2336 domain-containing protein [Govania unica]